MNSMIKITNACICYEDVPLFRHLNVAIEEGVLACITGPSGCGKSSLLHAVQGFVPMDEGEIEIGGRILTENTVFSLRRNIAWLPQELALPSEWVYEMVQLPFSLRAARKHSFNKKEFEKLLAELNLESGIYQKRGNEISGGQRQRLMIASAVMLHRSILLIDEPTSALDRESVECVAALFRRLAGEGVTVLSVSHDQAFIEQCDQIIDLPSLTSGKQIILK